MWLLDELENLKDCNDIAVIHNEGKITYKELWQRSEALSCFLRMNCYNKKPLVIYGDKEIDIIVAMHAALKVGIPYVPVDILYPVERLYKIANQVEAELIINFSDQSITGKWRVMTSYQLEEVINYFRFGISEKKQWVKDNDLCYVLFTSGSTGEPKGVKITKSNLVNFAKWFKVYCEQTEEVVVLSQAAYSFDLSVIALFVCLPLKQTLLCVDKVLLKKPVSYIAEYLRLNNLSTWISTPSFLDYANFMNLLEENKRFRHIILDGERLRKETAQDTFNRYENVRLINAYGPTEATVAITACEIDSQMLSSDEELPIGYLLPDGVMSFDSYENGMGELCVASKSVGQGYWKNEELTEEKFYMTDEGTRGYKTGDVVYEKDGLLYFVGRKDFQIKLNGFRIELNDIEKNINKLSNIENSLVLPFEQNGKIEYLIAFVVLKESDKTESGIKLQIRLKKELEKLVPSYMVPRIFRVVDSFPLNVNGKIDRKRLLEEF